MIDRSHPLPITRQAKALGLARATVYALPRPVSDRDLDTDQGSPFTSQAFTGLLKEHDIQISMDGKGAWRDHVFVERLWRSVKYEEVYLPAYDTVSDARAGIGRYFDVYHRRRPHSCLKRKTAYSGDVGPGFRFKPVDDSGPCRSSVTRKFDVIRNGVTGQDFVFPFSFMGLSRFRMDSPLRSIR